MGYRYIFLSFKEEYGMKKRSKVLSILLATAMAGSMLAGCGGSSDSGESTSEQSS